MLIQQRAPAVRRHRSDFCESLVHWVALCGFRQVVLLTGADFTQRRDQQLQGTPLRYLVSQAASGLSSTFAALDWRELERREDIGHADSKGVFLPGGGLARQVYHACCERSIPLVLLAWFCPPGDNMGPAFSLGRCIIKLKSRCKGREKSNQGAEAAGIDVMAG